MKWILSCIGLGALLNALYFLFWSLTHNTITAFAVSVVITAIIVFISNSKLNFLRIFRLSAGIGIAYIILAWILITIFPPTVIRDIGDIIFPYEQSLVYGLVTIAVIPLINMLKFLKN